MPKGSVIHLTLHYIDDVMSLNIGKFSEYLDTIYPSELEIKDTSDSLNLVDFLNLYLQIDENKLCTSLYDKRDDFNFNIVNFPFICLLYTSPSPRDRTRSRMPSSA